MERFACTVSHVNFNLQIIMKPIANDHNQPHIIKVNGSFGKEASFEFCPIPAGTFLMNSNKVEIDQDFYLGTYPVTQQQWEAIMGYNPSRFKGERLPVETVSWDDCQVFLQKLNTLSGKQTFRLPTEEEWEYACLAGSIPLYVYSPKENQLEEWEWYDCNSGQTTYPVGKNGNGWGLYDMTGNVWEWTDSWYNSSNHVIRGGRWSNITKNCGLAFRGYSAPGNQLETIGFRLLLVR